MRKLLALSVILASPALAQTPAGVINAPIYATGYISQVGGTNITTKIAAQPNHPTNLNIYTTSAITGVWTIQLPNPAFEGQVLSFNCGATVNTISIISTDGSSIDSNLPTTCVGASTFSTQFDQRANIWRYIGYSSPAGILPTQLPAFTGGACTTTAGSVVISCAPLLAAANTWTGIQRYGLNPMPNAGDEAAVNMFFGQLLVTVPATQNGVVGAAVQDGSNGPSFPTGVTGYGRLRDAGNTVFGLFGRADCVTAGVCTNEVDSFNLTSSEPVAAYPPNRSFGSVTPVPVAWTVAAGGTHSSLIGVHISKEGGTPQQFFTGLYTNPDAIQQYGVFVDASNIQGPGLAAGLFRIIGYGTDAAVIGQTESATPPSTARLFSGRNNVGTEMFGVDPYGSVKAQTYATSVPVVKTANYTVDSGGVRDSTIIFNGSGSLTVTLPSVADFPGRIIRIKTVAAQTVVSASSNVGPLAGGAAGTAILAATAGKWADLQSDGANWLITAGN